MAFKSKRTTELDELTSIALDDYYIIVDASDSSDGVVGKTKKVSHQTLSDAVGGVGAIDAGNISTGTLADARLSSNVTLKGNIFNGTNQLVQLDGVGKYPSNDGSQITNLNASNIASGEIGDNYIPSTVARTRRLITPVTTATTITLTEILSSGFFIMSHTTGTVVVNLDIAMNAGSYFTIINTGVGDIQIQSAGQILSPTGTGNVSLTGRSPGGRRVEIVCIDAASFLVSGDLLP